MIRPFLSAACCAAVLCSAALGGAGDEGWIALSGDDLNAWRKPRGDWTVAADAEMDRDSPRLLRATPRPAGFTGELVLVNGPTGKSVNLVSSRSFGDVEVHLEFLIPERSNSGVKLMGLYEIQIFDSWGVEAPRASDCGGIYPRAELKPSYHHIDDGVPPRVNAARPPGAWQELDLIFRAPRFDPDGTKIANARFDKVVLNGRPIHADVELATPTGHAWHDKEIATGPLLLQGDHGPVAFRNVRVRPSPGGEVREP